MRKWIAALVVALAFAGPAKAGGYATAPLTYLPTTPLAYGADPTGVVDSTTAINNTFTNATNIYIPCGTYAISGALAVTIPAGKNLSVRGERSNCVILKFSTDNGLTITNGDYTANFQISGITFLTTFTQPASPAINITYTTSSTHFTRGNTISDVQFLGVDYPTLDSKHWMTAIQSAGGGLNSLDISDLSFWGGDVSTGFGTSNSGNVINLLGTSASNLNSQIILRDSFIFSCNSAVQAQSYSEGLLVNKNWIAGCVNGFLYNGTVASVSSEFHIVDNTFNCITDVNLSGSGAPAEVIIAGNFLFSSAQGSTGVSVTGPVTDMTIHGNTFLGTAGKATTGILLGAASGTTSIGSVIGNNTIFTEVTGVQVTAALAGFTGFVNNRIFNTTDFTISSTAATQSFEVDGLEVRTGSLPFTCNAVVRGSRYAVTDATTPSWGAAYTSGGSTESPVFCDGTSWKTM